MNNEPKLLDVVALNEDIPAKHLIKGQVGAIVEAFGDDTYLVEFSDKSGRVYASEELKPNRFLKLYYESAPAYM
ncbi:MAG: DUF4926 domain-containing protein [Candidatus Kapabacteria bacterium]|nr:DUF4926 domain-containing protein [Candidatus Kapabacteria bacterium]